MEDLLDLLSAQANIDRWFFSTFCLSRT